MVLVKKKNETSPSFYFWQKKSQQNVFHDILERKKAFLDSAKCVWR